MGVGGYVEALVAANAGQGAGGDVAHHVAAGFLRGDVHCGQTPHEVGGIVDVNEVELEILPRGDVADGIGVLFRQVGQRLHLLGVEATEGNLDALHAGRVPHRLRPLGEALAGITQRPRFDAVMALPVVVALAVDAAPQARFGKNLVVNLVLTLQRQLRLENGDFLFQGRRQATVQAFLPGGSTHWLVP